MTLTQLLKHGKNAEIEPYFLNMFPNLSGDAIAVLICVILYLKTMPEEFRTKANLIDELAYLKETKELNDYPQHKRLEMIPTEKLDSSVDQALEVVQCL